MVNDKTKDIGPVLLTGLHHQFHSRMLSHYYSVWRLWAAVFRPWPVSPLLSQPGDSELPLCRHIDTELSADILSTWRFMMKNPQPQTIHYIQFSSSWVTEARHYSRTPPHRSHWDQRFFTFISGLPLKRGKITLNTIIWDLKMLTFIDGEPLKAGLLLRGPTVDLFSSMNFLLNSIKM